MCMSSVISLHFVNVVFRSYRVRTCIFGRITTMCDHRGGEPIWFAGKSRASPNHLRYSIRIRRIIPIMLMTGKQH